MICKGCKQCLKGLKSVILITGICPRDCFYCPLSDQKKNKDVMYCNERKVNSIKEIIEEVKISGSKGAGITGGDPLSVLDRTIECIKELKKNFSPFHIHLYTSLNLVTEEKLKKLFDAGLDEIRFHPDLKDEKLWSRLELAKKFKWKIGVEIPAIPGYSYDKLLNEIKWVDFLNVNELESSDTNYQKMEGFKCKNQLSYGIKGSEEKAKEICNKAEKLGIKSHYCSAKQKDSVQLAERLKRRAKNVAKRLDVVDEEGLLIRGIIYSDKKRMNEIKKEFCIPDELIEWDDKQILIASWVLLDIHEELDEKCAIVTEYPTYDRLVIEVNYL